MVETETYTIEGPSGGIEALELPVSLVDVFIGQSEGSTDIAAGVVVQALVQQAHAIAHHSEGGAPADIVETNEQMEELFEDRSSVPLSNALGHSY